MNFGRFFGWIIVALSLAASAGYAAQRDWRQAAYFLFAALINVSVIY